MNVEFHYASLSGVDFYLPRWMTCYELMLDDARRARKAMTAEVLIEGRLSYWLTVTTGGGVIRMYKTVDEEGNHETEPVLQVPGQDE